MINENLTNRVRELLADVNKVEEKKMFSGIAFMVDNKMCVAVGNNRILCRIDPGLHNELVEKPGCISMMMKGKDLQGYVYVTEDNLKTKKISNIGWGFALDYNPRAQASKKKQAGKKKAVAKIKQGK